MINRKWQDKKMIFFDLDGTLTDPGLGITNSVMYALERYGIDVKDRSELYRFIGPPLSESFERFYGFSKEDAVQAVEVYREYFSVKGLYENEVFQGIEKLLKDLKAQGKMVCLATSKPETFATKILEHFNLIQYFDYISGSMLSGERTNKAEVIEWLFKCFDQDGIIWNKEDIVMIGDREHDVKGAHKNHIPVIGVLFGYGSEEELTSAGSDALACSVENLHEMLVGEVDE